MERKHGVEERSIIDRIESCKKRNLRVSMREMEIEIARMAHHNKRDVMIELVNALVGWQRRLTTDKEAKEVTRARVLASLDSVAGSADTRKIGIGVSTTVSKTMTPNESVGDVQQWFRNTVSFNPAPSKT